MNKPGRKPGSAKQTATLTIGLSKEMKQEIENYCDNNKISSFSKFFRNAAKLYLDKKSE